MIWPHSSQITLPFWPSSPLHHAQQRARSADSPPPPPSLSPRPHFSLIFCSTQALSRFIARLLACVAGGIFVRDDLVAKPWKRVAQPWIWLRSRESEWLSRERIGEESSWIPACPNSWGFLNYAFTSAREFRIGWEHWNVNQMLIDTSHLSHGKRFGFIPYSSRTFGCWKSELAAVFQFFRQRLTITDLVLSSKELWLSTRPLGATITTFSWLVCFPSKSSTFRRSHLWSRTSTFEVSSFSSVDAKFNVFLTPAFLLWPFLGWGLRCGEAIEVGSRRLNLIGDSSPEEMFETFDCDSPVFLLRLDAINS